MRAEKEKKSSKIISFFLDFLNMRVIILVAFTLFLLVIAFYFSDINKKALVREDGVGYYSYLPAVIIYNDLSFTFLIDEDAPYTYGENSFEKKYNPEEAKILGFNKLENGNYINKYSIGVAVLLSPFFIIGHVLTFIFGGIVSGWSYFYQYSVFVGGIVYFFMGLFILKKVLLNYFSRAITFLCLILIVFGTNLFNYATYENVFSHVYSFFLINLLIFITPKWAAKKDLKNAIIIGIVAGLILLVRFTNLIFLFITILYNFKSVKIFLEKVKNNLKLYYKQIGIIILIILAINFFQFFYWKYMSGKWLIKAYLDEGFLFLQPKLTKVMFSTEKGLFFWSPILIFATVGLFMFKNTARRYLFAFIFVLITHLYLVSSWWNWEYGWSFGHRAFTDCLGIFAIGLGGLFSGLKRRWLKITMLLFSFALTFLSIFQMLQYWLRILPPARTYFEDYRRIFLRLDKDLRYFWLDKFNE